MELSVASDTHRSIRPLNEEDLGRHAIASPTEHFRNSLLCCAPMSRRAAQGLTALVLVLVFCADTWHIRRGLPNHYSMHPDAVAPLRALGVVLNYTSLPDDLVDKYPTFAYLYFGVPAYVALRVRGDAQADTLLERAAREGPYVWRRQVDPDYWQEHEPYSDAISDCIVAGRLASAVAGVLLALGGAWLAATWFGVRAMPLAAVLVGLHPYSVYYAHTMNVDAPSFAFLMLGLAALSHSLKRGVMWSSVASGVLFALSAAIKDQMVGFIAFVAVAAVAVDRCLARTEQGRRSVGRMAGAAAGFAITYLAAADLLFELAAWWRHAEYGLSPAIKAQYALPISMLEFQKYVLIYFARSADVAGAILMLGGLVFAVLRQRMLAVLLVVPALCFYVVFPMRLFMPYPRFLMVVFLPLLVLGAGWVATLLQTRGRPRWFGIAGVVLVAWVGVQGVAVNRLLASEPRYQAALWLQRNVEPGERVLVTSNAAMPPPLPPQHAARQWTRTVKLGVALAEFAPDYLVVVQSPKLYMQPVPERTDPVPYFHHAGWFLEAGFPRAIDKTPLTLWGLLDPSVWHPLANDIDVDSQVYVFRQGGR